LVPASVLLATRCGSQTRAPTETGDVLRQYQDAPILVGTAKLQVAGGSGGIPRHLISICFGRGLMRLVLHFVFPLYRGMLHEKSGRARDEPGFDLLLWILNFGFWGWDFPATAGAFALF